MVTTEQSVATTLEENYLDPLKKGEHDLADVKCGATYGATLVNNMVDEDTKAAKGQ